MKLFSIVPLAAGYLLILMCIVGCTSNSGPDVAALYQVTIDTKPPIRKFTIGDCLQYQDPDKESWEQGVSIYRIECVGKHAYQTSLWINTLQVWKLDNSSLDSLPFKWEDFCAKVVCPDVKGTK